MKNYCFLMKRLLLVVLFVLLSHCATPERKPVKDIPSDITPEELPSEFKPEEFESRDVIASWYGEPFHGKMTASGRKYDMFDMTCAHKTLPFGTQLKVSNVDNGKAVDVIVNDRGPFVRGRDIDLSYGAAKEIGLVGKGVGKVRISYVGRDESYRKKVRYNPRLYAGPFTIQVGAFTVHNNAVKMVMSLEHQYPDVYTRIAKVRGKKFYRVRLGRFPQRKEAVRVAERLAYEGYDVLVTGTKDNYSY